MAEHLQHAYALTAHTIQGATVEWAGVVGRPEDFTRNWSYTALSRAREPTELFIVDTPTDRELDRSEIAPGQARCLRDERTPIERLETAMRHRDDEDLALDRIDSERNRVRPASSPRAQGLPSRTGPSVGELQAELEQLRERIGRYPEHLADQLHAARTAHAEAQRVADEARGADRRARAARPRCTARARRGLRRTRAGAPTPQAHRGGIAAAAERERNLTSSLPYRAAWEAERHGCAPGCRATRRTGGAR